MDSKLEKKFSKWLEVILFSTTVLGFSNPSAYCQYTSESISFTKKEIAFFKWGTGEKEVSFKKTEQEFISHSVDQHKKIASYYWPRIFYIDGNDNIYLGNANGQIIIVSPDGGSIKTVSWEKTGGLWTVDGDGNIYARYNKDGEPPGFILTRPDGTQEIYKNFDMNYEENGIVYDLKNNKTVTISENGDKPEKLPPRLLKIYRGKNNDFEKKFSGSFTIYTGKINKHLKKINRHIETDKIQINIEGFATDLIGIDDNGNSYFFCWESLGNINAPWKETDVMIYSPSGQKLGEIPIELDLNKQTSRNEIQLDIQGNIFQMLASEDGIHILKWIKN